MVVDEGLTFVVGTHPTPIIINTAFRTDPSVAPIEVFARSQAFYQALGNRFTWLSPIMRTRISTRSQRRVVGRWPSNRPRWCVAPPSRTPWFLPVPRSTCRSAGGYRCPRGVVRDGFASDEDEIAAANTVFVVGRSRMPDTVAVIASIDGRDAAAAMVNVIDRMGYVGWVGTLPAFRRRGLGELVSRAATNAAFERGADIVALEASPMAVPLYSRIGYETVGIDRIWLPPAG